MAVGCLGIAWRMLRAAAILAKRVFVFFWAALAGLLAFAVLLAFLYTVGTLVMPIDNMENRDASLK